MTDRTRLDDLEILSKELERANTEHDRRDIQEAINRIMRTSVPIQSLRDDLVRATRARDHRQVKKIVAHINYIRQNETYGKEIS